MSDPSSQTSVLDPGALSKLRALQRPGRPSLVARIIAMFKDDAPRQVRQMEDAAANQDKETLHRCAHTLKSNAANIGAEKLREACETIERNVRNDELAAARDHLTEVPSLLLEVVQALDQEEEAA